MNTYTIFLDGLPLSESHDQKGWNRMAALSAAWKIARAEGIVDKRIRARLKKKPKASPDFESGNIHVTCPCCGKKFPLKIEASLPG